LKLPFLFYLVFYIDLDLFPLVSFGFLGSRFISFGLWLRIRKKGGTVRERSGAPVRERSERERGDAEHHPCGGTEGSGA
jgi:hypothetical protein